MQDHFDFESDTLKYSQIENKICAYCDIRCVDSSNLPPELKPSEYTNVEIVAQNGSISCRVVAYEVSNNEKCCYRIYVSNISVKHK